MTTTVEEKPTSSENSSQIDVMFPFYVHPSDSPGQLYITRKLHDGNYADWVSDMSNSLFARNKIGFVDGTIAMPKANSPKLMLWRRCNAMVRGWLNTAMEKEIWNSVKYAKTASEIWKDLEERFGKESPPRAYELKRTVTSTRQEGLSVSAYYTKLRSLWDEIQSVFAMPKRTCGNCTCDIQKQLTAMKEKERLYEFLMGLDETFGIVRTQILSTKPTPEIGVAYHLVSEDERQRQISTNQRPIVEAAAFQTQQVDPRPFTRKEGAECSHCHRTGHPTEECYGLVGYPAHWKRIPRGGFRRGEQPRSRRTVGKAAHVQGEESPIPGLTSQQFAQMVKYFGGSNNSDDQNPSTSEPTANIVGLSLEEEDWCG